MALFMATIRGIRHLEENHCYLNSEEYGERFLLILRSIHCLLYVMKYSHLRRLIVANFWSEANL